MPTDLKDLYVADLQRRLEEARAALRGRPMLPDGWGNAPPRHNEVAAVQDLRGGYLRAALRKDDTIVTYVSSHQGMPVMIEPTPAAVARYLLAREGAGS
jgi:hypothetical protein